MHNRKLKLLNNNDNSNIDNNNNNSKTTSITTTSILASTNIAAINSANVTYNPNNIEQNNNKNIINDDLQLNSIKSKFINNRVYASSSLNLPLIQVKLF